MNPASDRPDVIVVRVSDPEPTLAKKDVFHPGYREGNPLASDVVTLRDENRALRERVAALEQLLSETGEPTEAQTGDPQHITKISKELRKARSDHRGWFSKWEYIVPRDGLFALAAVMVVVVIIFGFLLPWFLNHTFPTSDGETPVNLDTSEFGYDECPWRPHGCRQAQQRSR